MEKYKNTNLSFEERAEALCNELTTDEKAGFLISENPPVERLGIPAYNWWNEGLHGLGRSGIATVFPQSIAMAATWDAELMEEVADTISTEFRAKSNAHFKLGHIDKYVNPSALSPNINIFRDPRWGRGHETYGECPTLTGRMGTAFVKGMQGDGKYIKTACCAKHYAVHSGPENERHTFDVSVSKKDLFETYLPAFKALSDAGVISVMSAYNAVKGFPCSCSKYLLTDILRDEFGFKGNVISDGCAVESVMDHHKFTRTAEETAAECLKAGLDIDLTDTEICGVYYERIHDALDSGLITEKDLNTACTRVLDARLRLGLFADDNEYTKIPYNVIGCEKHVALSEKVAEESIIMLKNDGILPLNVNKMKHILVVGPNAHDYEVNLGNYSGTPDRMVTVYDGIKEYAKGVKVDWTLGCTVDGSNYSSCEFDKEFGFYEAQIMAEDADAIIYVGGLNATLEGEEGDATNSQAGGDRIGIELPGAQNQIISKLCDLGKPVIVVNIAGGPVALNIAQEKANAVLNGLYLGQEAGTAVARVLFGEVSPCGKMPYTVPASEKDIPDITDYSMVGRTYRYMTKTPLYPFGFGLSYTSFEYNNLSVENTGDIKLTFDVKNTGDFDGKEISQCYISLPDAPCRVPIKDLVDFTKTDIKKGETVSVSLTVPKDRISYYDMDGKKQPYKGKAVISVGGSQGDERSFALGAGKSLVAETEIK